MLVQTTYTQARAHLAALCEQAALNHDVIIIKRRNAEDVAIISLVELSSLEETAHLFRSPKNAERLLTALQRARTNKGKVETIDKLRKELEIDQES
jgi:antitoxin YefM